MIKAVLFDMDGVLVDSEEFICRAAVLMFKEKGLVVQAEDFIPFVGMGENRYLGGVAEKYNFPVEIEEIKTRTYEIYGNIILGELEPLEGVIDFIATCKQKGLKIAVATSADEVKMKANLAEIGIPVETFDVAVNGLMIKNKKPNPEIFITAARLLGLRAGDCLVVEDAINGVEAGKRAGAKVLGVMTSFTKEQLKEADWLSKDLSDYPPEVFLW
ncbi:MAG: HAD-IA family hydrolase [Bacteroidales bacterium]|nr:HAD-IA family hydrolase [Bacteroidales bacterium]